MSISDRAVDTTELSRAFVTLNDYLHTGGDQTTALQQLVDLAVTSIPGCSWAAVTIWPAHQKPRSLVTSAEVAGTVDHLQYELGEGPCLTAATDHEVVQLRDLAADDRWPQFSTAVLSHTPVRGALSFHLVDQPDRSALNLYTDQPDTFDDAAVNMAALFAARAHILLMHAASAGQAANLQQALTSSRQIGAAIGILMNARKISEGQAFDLLRESSQHLNRKLRDIADDVTHTGTLPHETTAALP